MMKKSFLKQLGWLGCALVGALATSLGNTAQAALLAYEPFEYGDVSVPSEGQYPVGNEDAGTGLLGGVNTTIGPTAFYTGPWIQAGGDSQVVKAVPSLSYPGFQEGIGGIQGETTQFDCCVFGRTAREIAGGLGGGRDARTIYESFLIDFGSLGTDVDPRTDEPTDNDGNIGKHAHELWNGFDPSNPDASLAVDVFFNHFGNVFDLSLAVTTNSGTTTVPIPGGEEAYDNLSGTNLVVMKYEFNPAPDPDVVSVFFNPTSVGEPGTPSAQISVAESDLFITHHSAYTQFQFTGGGNIPGAIDEIRWGDTYRDVTPLIPEPTSLSLGLVSMLGMLLRRGRK